MNKINPSINQWKIEWRWLTQFLLCILFIHLAGQHPEMGTASSLGWVSLLPSAVCTVSAALAAVPPDTHGGPASHSTLCYLSMKTIWFPSCPCDHQNAWHAAGWPFCFLLEKHLALQEPPTSRRGTGSDDWSRRGLGLSGAKKGVVSLQKSRFPQHNNSVLDGTKEKHTSWVV